MQLEKIKPIHMIAFPSKIWTSRAFLVIRGYLFCVGLVGSSSAIARRTFFLYGSCSNRYRFDSLEAILTDTMHTSEVPIERINFETLAIIVWYCGRNIKNC